MDKNEFNIFYTQLLFRDFKRLELEILAYESDQNLWEITEGISNSGGNLCLHLIGNLRHFIGHVLGKTDYIRQRDDEFNLKGLTRIELVNLIEILRSEIESVMSELSMEDIFKEFPVQVFADQDKMNTQYFLMHLYGHFNYHLGQINYHRRILQK